MSADLKLSLGETQLKDIIRDQIAAAVIAGLAGNSEALVTAFVNEAMKPADRYSAETPLLKHAKALVQEVAKQELTKWVEKHRADIRKKMVAAIDSGKFSDTLVDALLDATRRDLYISIKANINSKGD